MIDETYMVVSRLKSEEEFRSQPYDDATGLTVHAPTPEGNLTTGYGCKLVWDEDFATKVLLIQVDDVAGQLSGFEWYQVCNAVRRSVLIDVAFNDGVKGLTEFKRMIAAILIGDWKTAAAECEVKNPKLQQRYAVLENLMLTGGIASQMVPTPA